ncbi:hypothetical protein GPECTOR_34g757 [Gonium pectorale]|uniref:SET domain-containing protein n=1 Tax=Gonium pectorale TaxID=33097 RepID=A0A150GCP6_GONPE|nr:hypothetical protein GPECTOR_34g757 [Gonium pectorale]|eukprot:KXZ47598.1 hypothetical protein GPECTOR_34g757 [Gonium pectorale]
MANLAAHSGLAACTPPGPRGMKLVPHAAAQHGSLSAAPRSVVRAAERSAGSLQGPVVRALQSGPRRPPRAAACADASGSRHTAVRRLLAPGIGPLAALQKPAAAAATAAAAADAPAAPVPGPTTTATIRQASEDASQPPPDQSATPAAAAAHFPSPAAPVAAGTPPFCELDSLSALLQQFAGRTEGFDSGLQIDGLLAYYRRLGCSPQQIQEAVMAAAPEPGPAARQQGQQLLAAPRLGGAFAGADSEPLPLPLLPSTLAQQMQVAAWELLAATVAAAALAAYKARPRGWSRTDLLEVRASPIAGRGVFARAPIPARTVLGSYPGRLRSGAEMLVKCQDAPLAASYAFRTGDGRFLDPTDASGQPSPYPQPGWPWPLPIDVTLAFVNEPPKGSPGTNASVEDGSGPDELLFVAATDVPQGAELFIDYGITYDRSGYGSVRD